MSAPLACWARGQFARHYTPLPLPLLASERRRQDRRGRRLLLLLWGRAGEGAMEVEKLCPPLASRVTAVSSSELGWMSSAGLAYGPTWPWA